MAGYELVSYEPGDRAAYLALLDEAWGELALSGEEFDWWFRENPAGSLMSVARVDGRVVGVAAHSLFRMVLGGEEAPTSFSVHATTAAETRGQGIFEALERRHEEEARARGVAVVLAFAGLPGLRWTESLDRMGRARLRQSWLRPSGTAIKPDNIGPRYMEPALIKAGVRRFRFHDLRHTFGSLLIQDGASLAYVKEQMGHSSIQLTVDIYGHLVPGANVNWVDSLDTKTAPQQSATQAQQGVE